MSQLLFNQFLHLNNIMLIPTWTSPLLHLFLRPPLLIRLVKVWIQVTRWLRRRRRSLISERLKVQLLPQERLLLINLPTLRGKSSSPACCARETIFFETALAFPRCWKNGPTVIHHCRWLLGVRLAARLQLVLVRLLRNRVSSPIPVSCVKGTMPFTFVHIWMKPSEFSTTQLFLHHASRLVTNGFLRVLHQLIL